MTDESATKDLVLDNAREDRAYWIDPHRLTAVKDKRHPLYNSSVEQPVNAGLVAAFKQRGFIGGALQVRPARASDMIFNEDGKLAAQDPNDPVYPEGALLVVDGRQRLAAALKAGLEEVRVFVTQPGDALSDYFMTVGLNQQRLPNDPFREAQEVLHLRNLGAKAKEIAVVFGWKSVDTVRHRLKLLTAAPEVQEALKKGEITASDAMTLADKAPEKQVVALASVPKKSQAQARRNRSAAKQAKRATGANSEAKRRPTTSQITKVMEALPKGEAKAALRYALGLTSIKVMANYGLPTDSPVYRHATARAED